MEATVAPATDQAAPLTALLSARLEVLLVVWRVREALLAIPRDPNEISIRRWNHGIARELWTAISALGLAAATEMTQSTTGSATNIRCKPISCLLAAATWETRRLRFNVLQLDTETYLSLSNIGTEVFHGLENSPVYPKWWTWHDEGPGEEIPCPGWWSNPAPDVGAPMLVFESDKDDLSATAGNLYTQLGYLSAEKEGELREIDDQIALAELDFSR